MPQESRNSWNLLSFSNWEKSVKDQTLDSICVHLDSRICHQMIRELELSAPSFTFMHWRRKWQPTLVLLPGESQRQRSLVGCHLWGRTESDTTEVT